MQQTEEEKNELLGISLFEDIEDEKLRAYNRCVIIVNLNSEGKTDQAKKYMKSIPIGGQAKLFLMAGYIQKYGFEDTLKEIRQ